MLFSFEGTKPRSGDNREVVTPGPISNPEVKHFIGEHSLTVNQARCRLKRTRKSSFFMFKSLLLYNYLVMKTYTKDETIELGERFGKLLSKGTFVALKGDLAGGKTTFTKGIGKALNIKQVINSPTFTILKIYNGDLTLYHIDAYRLENNEYDLGISEYEDEGITIVEWPEYYQSYLPKDYIEVDFKYIDDNTREINFINHGDKYIDIVRSISC